MMNKDFLQSKAFKKILCGIAVTVVALVILQVGMYIGYRKASFFYHGGDNYYRTFGNRRGEMPFSMNNVSHEKDFSNSHGAIGNIVKIELPTLILADRDGVEKVILIKDGTIIRRFRDTIRVADLKIGDAIIVIGLPNGNGQVEASLIRFLPSLPEDSMMRDSVFKK